MNLIDYFVGLGLGTYLGIIFMNLYLDIEFMKDRK